MNILLELCGRPERANAILAAVRRIVAEERRPTPAEVDAICNDLPQWTEAGEDEVAAAMDLLNEQIERDMQQRFQAQADTEAEPVSAVEEQPLAPTLSPDAFVQRLRQLNDALAEARTQVVRQDHLVREARGLVADALQAWVSGGMKITKEQAWREMQQTTAMVRAQRPGFKSPQNDGTAFLRKQMKRGRRRVAGGDVWTPTGLAQRSKLPSEL